MREGAYEAIKHTISGKNVFFGMSSFNDAEIKPEQSGFYIFKRKKEK